MLSGPSELKFLRDSQFSLCQHTAIKPMTKDNISDDKTDHMTQKSRNRLDGCIVWNAHNTVLGSKRLAICATV